MWLRIQATKVKAGLKCTKAPVSQPMAITLEFVTLPKLFASAGRKMIIFDKKTLR